MEISHNSLQKQDVARNSLEQKHGDLSAKAKNASGQGGSDLKEAFNDFVGQTFFSEMIKAARSTQQEAAYFNGGRAEEIFQGQFDQVMSEKLSDASAEQIADPMFELFRLGRQK